MNNWVKVGLSATVAVGTFVLAQVLVNRFSKSTGTKSSSSVVHQEKVKDTTAHKPQHEEALLATSNTVKPVVHGSPPVRNKSQTRNPIDALPHIPNVSNAQIARKLIADPMFQLSPKPNGLEDHIRSIMKKAMWDGIRDELTPSKDEHSATANKDFSKTLALCAELRTRLASVTPNRADLQQQVYELIDLELIKQMLENNAFDDSELTKLIVSVMHRVRELESPQRNSDTDAWLSRLQQDGGSMDLIDKFRNFLDYFHEKMDLLHLDVANFQLRTLAPVIRLQGVEFVRAEFQKQYGDKPTRKELPRLAQWLPARQDNQTYSQLRHVENVFETLWSTGTSITEPAAAATQAAATSYPETWGEYDLVEQLERQLQALCRVAYFVMRSRQLQPALVTSPQYCTKLVSDLFTYLLSDIPPSVVSVGDDGKLSMVGISSGPDGKGPGVKMVVKFVEEHVTSFYPKEAPSVDVTEPTFREAIVSALFPKTEDNVFKIVKSRLHKLLLGGLQEAQVFSDERSNLPPAQLMDQVVHLLDQKFKQELGKLGIEYLREQAIRVDLGILSFAQRDWAIHSPTYTTI